MVTENPNLATPQLTDFQQYTPSGLPAPNKSREGLNSEQLAAFAKNVANSTIPGLMNTASAQELYDNRRYPLYRRGEDLENIYGRDQSWYSSMGNALVKFGATTVGTFLQGFNNIPATISAIRNQDMSKLSGEGSYEESIDNWLKNLEDEFPNYYTRFEKEHPFLGIIPFAPGSANFWGDKIIKNLGFTAGAISNAIVTDTAVTALTGGTGTAPLIAAQAAKASLWLNKLFSTTNNLNKVLSVEKKLLNLKSLGNLSKINKFTSGASYATSLLGSARTEAAVESRGIYNSVKEQLIADYKLNNFGQDPQGLDLEDIENHAQNAMNTSFGINVGLLTVSNAIQFGNLFKSFNKSQNLINSLDNITLKQGVFQAITPETKAGKIWDSVKPSLKNIFSEGLYEEGGQFATEKGVSDYYTRKYLNKNSWDETSEIVNSTLKGLSEQFGSKEGYENMVIGAISSMLSGGVSSRIQKIKGTDEKTRTQKTVDILNKNRFRGTLSQQFENTANSVEIVKQMNEAVQKGDIYRYNNLKSDLFFEYVMSRSANGLHDVTIEELEGLKDLSNEEFESTFGVSFNNTNKSTVSQYVDSMISQANSIQKLANGINYAYKNPFKNPQTQEEIDNFEDFERYKLNLTYLAAQQPLLSQRLEDLSNEIFNINPDITLDLVQRLTSKEGLKELSEEYELKANSLLESINEITTPQDRRNINLRVKALQTASERTSRLSNEPNEADFNYLVNFELNAQEPGDKKIFGANATQLFNLGVDVNMIEESKKRASDLLDALSTEEGFNEFLDEQDKDIPLVQDSSTPKIINFKGEEEDLIVDREYEITKPKQAIVKKINDRRWEVTSPEGTMWSYHRTKKAAEASAKLQTEEFGDLNKVKILEFNPDNTIKVDDVNGNIYNIPVSRINGYQRVKTAQEVLFEAKQKLDEQLQKIQDSSGTVVTGDPTKESYEKESLKKPIEILFTSSTSQSEKEDIVKPHIIRTNKFKNNAKNFPSYKKLKLITFSKNQESTLGLTGLVDMAMDGTGVNPSSYNDPDNGYIGVIVVSEEVDGVYFVDENGKKLNKVGTSTDLNKVIFESMPTTSLIWKNGENRYRKGEDQEAINQAAQWKLKRNQILNSDKYEIYDFSISRGIAQIQDNSAQNPVSGTLIPENKIPTQEGLLVIPTTGTVSHKGQNYTFPNGRPILKYEDTFEPVQNNKFTKDQAKVIFNVLKALSDNILNQPAEDAVLDENYLTYLQNVLYFRKTKETSRNQIYIDTTTMEIFLGGKQYDITKIAENEENITNDLSENAYFAINNKTLKDKFDKPFIEYYLENNNLVTRKWPNYQSFLLSSKTPEGKQRSFIPVTTNINIPTEAIPNNFQQKYFILEGLEFPPLEKPKEEKKQDTLGFLAKKPNAELAALEEPEITIEEEKVEGDHLKVATLAKKAVNKEPLTTEDKAFLATYPNLFEQLFKAALAKSTEKEPAKIEIKKEDNNYSLSIDEPVLTFIPEETIAGLSSPVKNRKKQKEIISKFEELNNIIKCLRK